MPKTNSGLVAHAKSKLGLPYFFGAKMQELTQELYNRLKAAYPGMIPASDASKIGLVCCDCSGLISSFTSVSRSSQGYRDAAKAVYPISTIKDAPVGALVWMPGHIGVYVGMENGVPMYIAEDDSKNNCRKNKLPNCFTHWFLCADIDYPAESSGNKGKEAETSGNNRTIAAGDKVKIKPGAVYGGLFEQTRGKPVPDFVIARTHTVESVNRQRGEALLSEINSWVSLEFLTK